MLTARFLLLADLFPNGVTEEAIHQFTVTHTHTDTSTDTDSLHPDFRRELTAASGIANLHVRAERLAGLTLLLSLLRDAGIEPARYAFRRDGNGRPSLAFDGAPDFSISHDGGCAVCVLCDSRVGIDLTALSSVAPATRCHTLAKRYFSVSEQDELTAREPDETECRHRFARLWARREAYAKYTGIGLPDALRREDPRKAPVAFSSLSAPIEAETVVCLDRQNSF